MSNPPTYSPSVQYVPPQPLRTNVAAIVSLVAGILGCIPGSGIVALIFGVIGLSKSRQGIVGGRGMAIAGIVLGAIGLIWTLVAVLGGGAGIIAYKASAPSRATVKRFAANIGNQDAAGAAKECDSNMTIATIQDAVEHAIPWGKLNDSTVFSVQVNDNNGAKTAGIVAKLTFANAQKKLTAKLVKENDVYKISTFNFSD